MPVPEPLLGGRADEQQLAVAQGCGSEAGSEVRPAWSYVSPRGGKEAEWPGEAKIAGRAVLAGPIGEEHAGDLFLADISEVVTTRLNPEATLLVIESWTPQRGLRVVERE